MNVEERFASKYIPEPMSGCWIWTGSTTGQVPWLYGQMGIGQKKRLAHHVSWILMFGEIAPKLLVLHKCDVTLCVNPDHLFLGTVQDNMDDMKAKGRRANPWTSRLTAEQVKEIRALHCLEGLGNRRLAKRFGIDQAHAWRIISGNVWKDIGGRDA